jgi:hypothetical protein
LRSSNHAATLCRAIPSCESPPGHSSHAVTTKTQSLTVDYSSYARSACITGPPCYRSNLIVAPIVTEMTHLLMDGPLALFSAQTLRCPQRATTRHRSRLYRLGEEIHRGQAASIDARKFS